MEIDLEKYNHECYIVGGGTSLKTFRWELLNDESKFVIAINTSHIMLPTADLIYVTDPPFITANEKTLAEHKAPVWQGALNVTLPKKLEVVDKQIRLIRADNLVNNKNPYEVAHGSCSPYACTNLMANLGFKKIFLLGIDMKYGVKGDKDTSHWHSEKNPHQRIDPESTFTRMLMNWKTIKQPLLDMGVIVINVNTPEGTALDVFSIQSVAEVFNP